MSPVRVIVLVEDAGACQELRALVARAPWGPSRDIELEEVTGDLVAAVAAVRDRDPKVPLGAYVRDEPTVLGALAAGADEAAILAPVDSGGTAAFLDRLDLRARLRAEGQRLHDALAHAERLTALGTLVASIGHEINNPLTAIELSIDVARRFVLPGLTSDPKLEAYASGLFEDLGSAAESVASIVRDLRVFSRADRNEPLELVDVATLVDQAIRLVGRELIDGLVERDYSPDLPKLVVPRSRVAQVIINLLINAAHAMRDYKRPVHRLRVSARADDEYVAIAVSDTGPGVPPDQLERIFDPFFTTKRAELGTGLGLSISRSILRRLGGDLSVESVHGDGATFICLLPVPSPDARRLAARRAEIAPPKRGKVPEAKTILLVEDDARVLRSYVRLLNPVHRVVIAADGRDAIEVLESGSEPDVVLLELHLPELDGRRLLAWLAENRPALYLRALVVTSSGTRPEHAEFLRTYDGPVLHKPLRAEALFDAIDALPWAPPSSG